jgi:hypothetical protein
MNFADVHRLLERGEALDKVAAWTVDLLAEIIEGSRPLAAVRHPLGFVCLPVLRSGPEGICVHLWDDDLASAVPTTSQIHAHSWDLLSYVLFGELHNEVIEVADEDAEPMSRVYEIRSLGDVDEIFATARLVRHATLAVDVNRAGSSYTLPAGAFHTTVVPQGRTTATVALGIMRDGAHDLSLGPVRGVPHRVHRTRCDHRETVRAARTVADHAIAYRHRNDEGRGS